jgi:hypothetical protein
MTEGCDGCEAEGLARLLAVGDLLEIVIWRATDPLRGIDSAMTGLRHARRAFINAGYEPQEEDA